MRQAKYSVQTDPTVEEVKNLCLWCRETAKIERVLFHYNGHGVPQPTSNGEIWVFNEVRKNTVPLWCIVFCTAGKWQLEIITDWWWHIFCAEFHNIHTTIGLWVGIMAWKPIHLCVWLFSGRHDCKCTLWGKTVYILSFSFFLFFYRIVKELVLSWYKKLILLDMDVGFNSGQTGFSVVRWLHLLWRTVFYWLLVELMKYFHRVQICQQISSHLVLQHRSR